MNSLLSDFLNLIVVENSTIQLMSKRGQISTIFEKLRKCSNYWK